TKPMAVAPQDLNGDLPFLYEFVKGGRNVKFSLRIRHTLLQEVGELHVQVFVNRGLEPEEIHGDNLVAGIPVDVSCCIRGKNAVRSLFYSPGFHHMLKESVTAYPADAAVDMTMVRKGVAQTITHYAIITVIGILCEE